MKLTIIIYFISPNIYHISWFQHVIIIKLLMKYLYLWLYCNLHNLTAHLVLNWQDILLQTSHISERGNRFLFDELFSDAQHVVRLFQPSWGCVGLWVPQQTGGHQPSPSTGSRTTHRSFGRWYFSSVHISGLLLRLESELLFAEQKNGIHRHATHGSKRTGFTEEEETTKLPA